MTCSGVLTSAMPLSLRMHPLLIFLDSDVLGKTCFPHKLQPWRTPTAAVRPGSPLPVRTHAHSKRGFLIHSNKAFGFGMYKIGAKRKQERFCRKEIRTVCFSKDLGFYFPDPPNPHSYPVLSSLVHTFSFMKDINFLSEEWQNTNYGNP